MKVEIIDPKFLNDGKGKEWKKGEIIELGKGQTKEAIERGFVKQIDNEKKNKTIPTKKVLKRKKKTKEKAYTGKGQIRVKLDLTKEKEIRNMLAISEDYKLFEFASVKNSEYFDLKTAGLATITDGQQKVLLKSKQKINLKGGIEKPEILLPDKGILISQFAKDVAKNIRDKDTVFYRIDQKAIVEVGKIKDQKTGEEIYTGFIPIKPNRFITLLEQHITPGTLVASKEDAYQARFMKESVKRETANTVLCSQILQEALQQIERIFPVPIPIIFEGKITFPCTGYDKRFCSWLPHDAPKIINPEMSLEDAKELIKKMFGEFCFQKKQDYYNAIAGLLSPFLKGLYPSFNTRPPIWFYLGNRERTGKDYLAGITGILYEGAALEEPPISSDENKTQNNSEELRKKFLAALITGRKRLHFSNNKGNINNVTFETMATAEKFSDRVLGKNEILAFENEIDFSLSGNAGVSFTPDFAARCRFINLFLDIEDANSRKFKTPNLHGWVKKNRGEILSALYALVRNWVDAGQPKGSLPFASYNNWAEICGGILETAGFGNPCEPDKETMFLIGGDDETNDMKELFEECYKRFPDDWLDKKTVMNLVIEELGLFTYLELDDSGGRAKLGRVITKFIGRVFSDIRLIVANKKIRADRQKLCFTKEKPKEIEEDVFGENSGKEIVDIGQQDLKVFSENNEK